MSIQINFKKVENISFDEQIHSYTELMEEMRTKNMYNQCEQKQNEPNILHARIKEKTMPSRSLGHRFFGMRCSRQRKCPEMKGILF